MGITSILSYISTLWSIVSTSYYKWIIMGVGIVVFIVTGIIYYQHQTIESLKTQLNTCNVSRLYEKTLFDTERLKAITTIENQNKTIKQFELDIKTYQLEIRDKIEDLNELNLKQQSKIRNDLSKDSSETNQLKIMNKLLEDFNNENP